VIEDDVFPTKTENVSASTSTIKVVARVLVYVTFAVAFAWLNHSAATQQANSRDIRQLGQVSVVKTVLNSAPIVRFADGSLSTADLTGVSPGDRVTVVQLNGKVTNVVPDMGNDIVLRTFAGFGNGLVIAWLFVFGVPWLTRDMRQSRQVKEELRALQLEVPVN